MNKKLLLSFAVFAATLGATAQQKNNFSRRNTESSIKPIENYYGVQSHDTDKKMNVKRGDMLVVDTIGMLQEKAYYASPFRRTKTVQNYFYNSTTDLTQSNANNLDTTHLEFTTYTQMVVNNAKFKLKGLRFPYVAITPNAFDVKVYAIRNGEFVKLTSSTVVPTTTGAWVTGRVIFDAAIDVVDDTLLYQFEPAEVKTKFVLQVGGVYGKAFESTAATVIKGTADADTLSVTTWKAEGNYKHSYFFAGQVVTGTDLDANTVILKRVGLNKYLIKPQTNAGSTFAVAGTSLKYKETNESDAYALYTKFPTVKVGSSVEPDFNQVPEVAKEGLYYTQTGQSTYVMEDTDLDFSAIVEYTLSRSASINSKCLGTSKTVEVTIADNEYSKNPFFNYYAFGAKYLGKKATDGILYSRIYSANKLVAGDSIDAVNDVNKYSFTYASDDSNDTLRLYDRFFAWSKGQSSLGTDFLISSKISSTASISEAVKCNGGEAKVNVASTVGGFSPYTGEGVQTGVKAGSHDYTVTDANGCTGVANIVVTEPSAIALDSNAVIASNDVTADGKAIVIATGGTAPYSYTWVNSNETNDTIVVGKGSYKVYVKDANDCATFATITVGAGTASVADLAIKGLAIYPNPVASQLNVTFNANSAATVELLNVAGQVIESKNTTNVVNTSFNTEKLTSGVYFVSIKVAEGTFTQKVIKD